jgi:thiamine pyrophosphate-dependent acetolactate synthase large subunit-like protein
MAKKRVADVLVDTLVAAGVRRVYGLVGDSLNGVTDSIRPRKDLQWVPVRHEETAAFAAGATGFGVFMLKAVLSGRGDEIVDLAKVNLFR